MKTLDFHFIEGRSSNSNVIIASSGRECVIIDAGTGSSIGNIVGETHEHVKAVVLTHIHIDHSGGAAELAHHFNVPVFIHKAEAPYLMAGDNEMSAASLFGLELQAPDKVSELTDGDAIEVGSEELTFIHLPGHSPGSIALLSTKHHVLISGDIVFASRGVGRWDLPGGSYRKLKRSVKKLMKLPFDTFLPGHGPPGHKDTDLPPYL